MSASHKIRDIVKEMWDTVSGAYKNGKPNQIIYFPATRKGPLNMTKRIQKEGKGKKISVVQENKIKLR